MKTIIKPIRKVVFLVGTPFTFFAAVWLKLLVMCPVYATQPERESGSFWMVRK